MTCGSSTQQGMLSPEQVSMTSRCNRNGSQRYGVHPLTVALTGDQSMALQPERRTFCSQETPTPGGHYTGIVRFSRSRGQYVSYSRSTSVRTTVSKWWSPAKSGSEKPDSAVKTMPASTIWSLVAPTSHYSCTQVCARVPQRQLSRIRANSSCELNICKCSTVRITRGKAGSFVSP